ncbi:MAG: RIP metalloprotease RseP [Chitinophagales bacterium]|nr:RIP metalloprotease RseP [Chitinophagales bacterium]
MFIFFDAWGTKLWSKKIGETEYGIGWLPLGGYVKIAGMIDESMDTEKMKAPPQPWEFRSKPAWQRFIVMIGGIVMNVLLGIVIFAFYLHHYDKDYLPVAAMDKGIYAFEAGEELGFKTGDKLLSINGKSPNRFEDYRSMELLFGADVKVERNGQTVDIQLPDTLFSRKGEDYFVPYNHKIEVLGVLEGSAADKAKLQKGDYVVGLKDELVENFGEMQAKLELYKNQTVPLDIERDGKMQTVEVAIDSTGKIGFFPFFNYKAVNIVKPYSWAESFKYGIKEGWEAIYFNAKGIGLMFTGKINPVESMQSPIGIAKFFGSVWNWQRFWRITGLLSFVLAFMNILPIPALDGGHILFIIIETLRGKPLSDKFLERAQIAGMLLLIPLMILIMAKDIWQILKDLF